MKISRYIALRLVLFIVVIILAGFFPGQYLFGDMDVVDLPTRPMLNHLAKGMLSTLTCAGGFATINIYASASFFPRFIGREAVNKRGTKDAMVVLIVVGLGYLLYHFFVGAYDIVRGARAVAGVTFRNSNRKLREDVARRFRVINLHDTPQPDID